MRDIAIIGDLDASSFAVFDQEMTELEASRPKMPIKITLCSGGGDTYVGLAYYARIKMSRCEVQITVLGYCMSAATAIFAAGTKRYIDKDAWVMVHDDSDNEAPVKHLEQVETQWADIMARHSNDTTAEWRKRSNDTTYMTAQEVVRSGLAHAIKS